MAPQPTEPIYEGPPVYAGLYDDSFYHYEFSTPQSFTLNWDTVYHYGYGEILLDIYGDGSNAIKLALSMDDTLIPPTDEGESFYLVLPDSMHASLCPETVCYFGSCHDRLTVDTLAYGERIDTRNYPKTSSNEGKRYSNMWSWWEYEVGSPSKGAWYYTSGIRYAAFRTNSLKHGWIEIDSTDPEQPKVLSFAMQH